MPLTASKQRVAWLVVRWDGTPVEASRTKSHARWVAKSYRETTINRVHVVRATYDWPQKGARKG